MMKQFLAMMIAVLLVCSVCVSAPSAYAADSVTTTNDFYGRKADASTMDSWTELFGPDVNNTANVGTVWTDKTVTETKPEGYNFPMKDDGTNFMVTLSTLSATMSITGHETLPTDTVFVLDLSSSMYRFSAGNYYSTQVVGEMIKAVNNAIHQLLTLNKLNRVGVVVYWGGPSIDPQSTNQHCTRLLDLGNYEELTGKNYLQIDLGSASYSIKDSKGKVTEYNETNTALVGIHVNPSLKTRAGVVATSTYYVMPGNRGNDNIAGTYMQLGIETAQKMFTTADTTIPADADFQAGATRIPILVLMSDGEPTAASVNYQDVAKETYADMGNNAIGERSPAETDFLTQLTAAYTRKLMDDHYVETTPLFYTLGLETNSVSYDVMDPKATDEKYANSGALSSNYQIKTGRSVSPKYTNRADVVNARINHYWEQMVNLSNNQELSIEVLDSTNGGNTATQYWEVDTVKVKKINNFPSSLDDKNYVDHYFVAQDENKFDDAFQSLVDEIILQSEYYPTYVENGAIGMSGYVDFHDEIGDMMEVKAVHGLARKATVRELQYIADLGKTEEGQIEQQKIKLEDGIIYYRGEQIAKYFADNMYDNTESAEDKAEITQVLTKLFQVRLGLNADDAYDLLTDIRTAKAIYYQQIGDTVKYSNSFTWYANKDEEYLELVTKTDGVDNPPSEDNKNAAAYKITSYWYASPYDLENTNSFIRVKTDLSSATQKQCVTWSIPASMIPLVRYQVNLTDDELDVNDTGITVEYKDNYPMRAFFEVGLRHDVNKYNAVEKLKGLNYEAVDGKYTFYSNAWNSAELNPRPNVFHTAGNTIATFHPSPQNARYFITSGMPLYNAEGNNWTSGDAYVKLPVFYTKGSDDLSIDPNGKWNTDIDTTTPAVLQLQLEKISAGSANGSYVNIHTPRSSKVREVLKDKYDQAGNRIFEGNQTDSLIYSTYENPPSSNGANVLAILGNNGIFHFTADTGIAITKALTVPPEEGQTPEFTFIIEPEEGNTNTLNGNYAINYHMNGVQIPDSETSIAANDGKITIKLHNGETAYLAGSIVSGASPAGLPAGNYIVTEQITGEDGSFYYEVDGVKVNGKSVGSASSNPITVEQFEVTKVDYTNKPVATGSIKISKTVTSDEDVPAPDVDFTFSVKLDKERHGNKTFTMKRNANGAETQVTADADGLITGLEMKAGEFVTISGLAADQPVEVTVTEENLPDGFTANNSSLTATVESNKTAFFDFTNVYAVTPTSVSFSGTKTLSGRDLQANEFSFALYTTGADYDITGRSPLIVKNAADGSFGFAQITYTAPGVHYYVVKEVIPEADTDKLPSVTYDSSYYQVMVTVKDNKAGQLVTKTEYTLVKADGATEVSNAISFTNTYEARDSAIVISGTKTMDGIRPIAEDEFTFELLQTKGDFTTIIEGTTAQRVTNKLVNGQHTFTFEPLEHAAAGTYYYVVKEVPGALPGVSYDPCEYHITVEVTDDTVTGQLVPKLVGEAVKVDPTKANVLTINTPAQITLPVNQLVFTNSYDTADTSVTFSGTKRLTGRPAVSDEFTFELYKTGSDYVIAEGTEPVATVKNVVSETGNTFAFPAIAYSDTDVGKHHYVILEKDTGAFGVDYDTRRYEIQVEVSDTANAALEATITGIPEDGLIFSNTYDATDTSFTFSGKKTLTGRQMAANEFSFTLYEASLDPEGKFVIGEKIETVYNDAEGNFAFSTLPDISEVATYYYTVKEDEGALPGVAYDKTEHHITVEVIDDGAALRPTATVEAFLPSAQEPPAADGAALFAVRPNPIPLTVDSLSFTNVYDAADTSVTFSGTKTLSGRSMNAGEFSFTLFAADQDYNPTGMIETVQNTADGSFAFSAVPLDAVGVYHYVILEQRGPLSAMTYDPTEYRIEVIVTDVNAALQKAVTVTIKDDLSGTTLAPDALRFHNIHDETDAVVVFSGMKTFNGHHLAHGDFTFTLYSADAQFNVIAPLKTATNAIDGSFAFTPMVYAQSGTWRYVVREDHGGKSYIAYDQAEYRITVNVWNSNGVLVADVSAVRVLGAESTPADVLNGGLAFTNQYTPASVTVPFPGKKVYQGAELTEGLFTFQLYAADPLFQSIGAPLETVTNGLDGSFAFTPRVFSSAGVYHFLVAEDAALPMPGVTYDTTVYHVTVTVTDNGLGSLEATTQVTTSEGLAAEMPVFENFYWEIPDTGDHSELETMLALCLSSLTALAALLFISRRKVRS